jgi:hypothetical protein
MGLIDRMMKHYAEQKIEKKKEIVKLQEQLANTKNDPNLTITTSFDFPLDFDMEEKPKDFEMEDVLSLSVESSKLIEDRLKEFGIVLTDEQEDYIHDATWKILEDVSTGYYRHHH